MAVQQADIKLINSHLDAFGIKVADHAVLEVNQVLQAFDKLGKIGGFEFDHTKEITADDIKVFQEKTGPGSSLAGIKSKDDINTFDQLQMKSVLNIDIDEFVKFAQAAPQIVEELAKIQAGGGLRPNNIIKLEPALPNAGPSKPEETKVEIIARTGAAQSETTRDMVSAQKEEEAIYAASGSTDLQKAEATLKSATADMEHAKATLSYSQAINNTPSIDTAERLVADRSRALEKAKTVVNDLKPVDPVKEDVKQDENQQAPPNPSSDKDLPDQGKASEFVEGALSAIFKTQGSNGMPKPGGVDKDFDAASQDSLMFALSAVKTALGITPADGTYTKEIGQQLKDVTGDKKEEFLKQVGGKVIFDSLIDNLDIMSGAGGALHPDTKIDGKSYNERAANPTAPTVVSQTVKRLEEALVAAYKDGKNNIPGMTDPGTPDDVFDTKSGEALMHVIKGAKMGLAMGGAKLGKMSIDGTYTKEIGRAMVTALNGMDSAKKAEFLDNFADDGQKNGQENFDKMILGLDVLSAKGGPLHADAGADVVFDFTVSDDKGKPKAVKGNYNDKAKTVKAPENFSLMAMLSNNMPQSFKSAILGFINESGFGKLIFGLFESIGIPLRQLLGVKGAPAAGSSQLLTAKDLKESYEEAFDNLFPKGEEFDPEKLENMHGKILGATEIATFIGAQNKADREAINEAVKDSLDAAKEASEKAIAADPNITNEALKDLSATAFSDAYTGATKDLDLKPVKAEPSHTRSQLTSANNSADVVISVTKGALTGHYNKQSGARTGMTIQEYAAKEKAASAANQSQGQQKENQQQDQKQDGNGWGFKATRTARGMVIDTRNINSVGGALKAVFGNVNYQITPPGAGLVDDPTSPTGKTIRSANFLSFMNAAKPPVQQEFKHNNGDVTPNRFDATVELGREMAVAAEARRALAQAQANVDAAENNVSNTLGQ